MATAPFKVKAIYDYSSPHDDDLSFSNGQIITVKEEEDSDWYVGEYTDQDGNKQDGLFPRNFVERYEPAAPPRPSRPRPKQDQAPPVAAEPGGATGAMAPVPDTNAPATPPLPSPTESRETPAQATSPKLEPPSEPRPQPAQPATSAKAPLPPSTTEKPSGNAFKDRIAAFNKPAAPPVAPKPSGPAGGSTFIKKPFVAPPPARNAYVPPPQQTAQPQKVYRRDEDPEIAASQAQAQKDAENAGLVGGEDGEPEEEAPKATSLKERIALLQKQQQEQGSRKAEGTTKEKPKRPAKPRTESSDGRAHPEDRQIELGKVTSPEPLQRQVSTSSIDALIPSNAHRSSRHSLDPPLREIASDGNDADQSGAGETTEDAGASSTEVEEIDERSKGLPPSIPSRTATGGARNPIAVELAEVERQDELHDDAGVQQDDQISGEEDEEADIDPEARRKAELRERMAKMSGGMGMAGMFSGGMPTSSSAPKRPAKETAHRTSSHETASPPPTQRMPMIPVPGMPRVTSPLVENRHLEVEKEPEDTLLATTERPPNEVPDVEDVEPQPSRHAHDSEETIGAPPIPQGRSLPPTPKVPQSELPTPIPSDRPVSSSRAVPSPPSRPIASQPEPLEYSTEAQLGRSDTMRSADGKIIPTAPPPRPGAAPGLPSRQASQGASKRMSNALSQASAVPSSPPEAQIRTIRAPPPPPIGSPQMLPTSTAEGRPPPPPPPSAVTPSRRSIGREPAPVPDDGGSDYEGDYDTDIASGTHHKDALKAHERPSSIDEGTLSEEASFSPPSQSRPNLPPPIPQTQRAAPPPPPHQPPPASRRSMDAPRAPPPMPPPRGMPNSDDDDYDPYRYTGPPPIGASQSDIVRESDPRLYGVSPAETQQRTPPPMPPSGPPPQKYSVPPPLPPDHAAPPLAPPDPRQSSEMSRSSIEPPRRSMTSTRRSMDPGSIPTEGSGQIARDVDLAPGTAWWTQPQVPPPVFRSRPDVLLEVEESSTSKRGGRTTTQKDVYALFQDYSQTVVTARFDPKDPSNSSTTHLEQRHEAPPTRLRQEQLETVHFAQGAPIASLASQKLSTSTSPLGDGSPQALIVELLRAAAPTALLPVGTRAYGALVYANMANATIIQHDEIRPGDIVSFRNARFQGKHGAMHAKYAIDVGKPEHVSLVMEWDGTKKKIRAWEQGRDVQAKGKGDKIKIESYRVGDLRSGEVKVWRVIGRDWVGWEGES